MSDQEASTPRVFFVRHGETEWAKNGRYTGKTDIDLTTVGIAQVSATAELLVGPGKMLDPSRLVHTFVSPRKRAVKTYDLLLPNGAPGQTTTVTEDLAEWDYGDYEGLKTKEIRDLRKSRALDREKAWDIWTDGCENGESSDQVATRLDRLIRDIRAIQAPHMNGEKPADVLLVAHGHILRCLAKRWLGLPLGFPLQMMIPPGAIGVLSYKNKNVNEPAFCLGLAIPPTQDAIC